jgi:hypothetical protein
LIILNLAAGAGGHFLRRHVDRAAVSDESAGSQESYIVSSVLGLLAILLGFTLAMALDRYDVRRHLVVEEANSIGTAYLRAQLLGEPHRTRLSNLLVEYTDNRIELATASGASVSPLLAKNNELLTSIWAATAAGFDSISNLDFSSTFVESVNNLIDLDSTRKASRLARVPGEVFLVLLIYSFTTSIALGYTLIGPRGKVAGAFFLSLLSLSLVLIIDLDRPTSGNLRESQAPMERLLSSLKANPPGTYDRWRAPDNKAVAP